MANFWLKKGLEIFLNFFFRKKFQFQERWRLWSSGIPISNFLKTVSPLLVFFMMKTRWCWTIEGWDPNRKITNGKSQIIKNFEKKFPKKIIAKISKKYFMQKTFRFFFLINFSENGSKLKNLLGGFSKEC